jgi:AcrR family transcriptional regulator
MVTTFQDSILRESVHLAQKFSLGGVTRKRVAQAVGCSTGVISYHYGTMHALREAVIDHAIRTENLPLLAIYASVPKIAWRLSPALKKRVAAHIAGK